VWKIKNADSFSATPFLSQAKGPVAPIFYAMLPDLDGRQRLSTRPVVSGRPLVEAWEELRANLEAKYKLDGLQKQGSHVILWDHQERLEEYLRKHNAAISGFFADRSEGPPAPKQAVPEELRGWLSAIRDIEDEYHAALRQYVVQGSADPQLFTPVVPGPNDRLELVDIVGQNAIRNPAGRIILSFDRTIPGWEYTVAWHDLLNRTIRRFKLGQAPEQYFRAKELYHSYKDSAEDYLALNQEFIEAHFQSADRYYEEKSGGNVGAPFQDKRLWDRQQELRQEVNEWLSELDGMGEDYRLALWNALDENRKERGAIAPAVPETNQLPFSLLGISSRTQLTDLAVTYGLTAIGVCLMVGFCTRLACLGGGVFLIFVLLTQPPWPSIYPPAPPVVGHALIVDKNFVEMIALFALATTAVGRWGGLDFFLYHLLGKPLAQRFKKEAQEKS
jgi:uncharacterized membrane protein YphA (DoxX/SURF4 family)